LSTLWRKVTFRLSRG